MPGFISTALTIVAMIGVAYTLAATALAGRWRPRGPVPAPGEAPSITMLKPLYGPEPKLEEKLAGFLDQDYPGPIDMVCGVARTDDPATQAARAASATLVVDGRRHGSNAKISNLINMAPSAQGELLVLSDSDMAVPRDYAARIVAEMAQPDVGAVTLLYAGRGETGGWSRLAAAGISWGFLPSVMIGLATGMAKPCMGSTIAIRRETLNAIGGFERFADLLADDHAIGAAVREAGLEVVVPPLIVLHGSTEASLGRTGPPRAALERHRADARPSRLCGERRHLPHCLRAPGSGDGRRLVGAGHRVAVAAGAGGADRPYCPSPHRAALVDAGARPVVFRLYVGAFFTRRVDWRGTRLHMAGDGRIDGRTET